MVYVFLRPEERAGEATDLATEPLPTPGEKTSPSARRRSFTVNSGSELYVEPRFQKHSFRSLDVAEEPYARTHTLYRSFLFPFLSN